MPSRHACPVRLILLALALAGAGQSLAAGNEAGATKQKIDAVAGDIRDLQKSIQADQGQKNDAQRDISKLDRDIAATLARVKSLQTQIASTQEQLRQLQAQKDKLQADITRQKNAISELAAAGYRQGPQGPLKSALNQQDPSELSRLMTYQRYAQQARRAKLDEFADMLDTLAKVEVAAQAEVDRLAKLKVDVDKQQAQLAARKAERKKVLAALDAKIAQQGTRLQTLEANKANLESVLKKIQDAMARMGTFDGGTPLAQQRGRLPWPVAGKLVHSFGSTREGDLRFEGVLIGADEGTAVHSVHNGLVVFAEWMRGYGMLVIIDHGRGFVSLYGNNQSLSVKPGDKVEAGDVVAYSGSSGLNEPGSYFELRQNSQPADPAQWCSRH